jgi:acetoin utilization protein AcuB
MKPQTPVSDIMIKNIIGLTISDDLERAEMLFKKHKIKHIPVVSSGVIIGMVSYTDLVKNSQAAIVNGDGKNENALIYNGNTVEQIMSKDVLTITSDTTIKEATKILAKREFHALPIVDNGELVGIITTRDLLKYFLKQY